MKLLKVEKIGDLHIFSSLTIFLLVLSITLMIFKEYSFPARIEGVSIFLQPYFMLSLLHSFFIASLPLSIRIRQILNEIGKLNESIIILYDSLSIYLRAGLTLIEALDKISNKITSRILRHRIKILISLSMQGVDFQTSLNKVVYGLPVRITNALLALQPVSEAGGKSPEISILIRDFYEGLLAFDRLKRSSLSVYLYIIFLSLIVFEGTNLFLTRLYKEISFSQSSFFQPVLDLPSFFFFSNLLIILVVFFSSMIISKIIRGSIIYFFDYFAILLAIHIVFFYIITKNYL